MGATDGEESTGAPASYGQPPTPEPLEGDEAYSHPARSPTTTEGCPSRSATLGEESTMGLPPSLRVCVQTWFAVKPAGWATSAARATGASPRATVIVMNRTAAAADMNVARNSFGARRLT